MSFGGIDMEYRLLVGLIGSALLVTGVAVRDQRRKNHLFSAGNACMFMYALLGYLQGGPIFFLILQTFVALATVCMLFVIPDAYTTPILIIGGIVLVAWSVALFQDESTAIFVVGLVLLGLGFAMNAGTRRREIALMVGSAVIVLFSFLMRDWVFFSLNFLFAVMSFLNILRFWKR